MHRRPLRPRRTPVRRRAATAALAAASLTLTACAAGSSSPGRSGDPAAGSPFDVQEVEVFDEPWAMEFLPGSGDLLVSERNGTLHLRDAETGELTEVSGVPEVVDSGQAGLGDVVAAPSFEQTGLIYLSWAEAGEGGVGAAVGRARLVDESGDATLADLEVVWRQTPKVSGDGHLGHRIAFDAEGEHLYVSSGDRQLADPAQDTSNTLGTIVRLTLDGDPAPGNPLADRPGVTAEIYSWGHRNPLGLDFAPDGRLWSSEMGPEGGDELNLVEAGENYGWPAVSNGSDYGGGEIPDHEPGDGFTAPKAWWTPSISPGSLMIYDGDLFEQWRGDAFLGALSGEALVRVDLDGDVAGDVEVWELDGQRVRAVEQGPDGAIWLLEDQGAGRLLRLTPGDG